MYIFSKDIGLEVLWLCP